ncbi:MAG: ATP-dependent sacrificial sulfur transferase LarE [Planctomycetaceae bacterium]|nr:MAG: ATP-dependent sacrificial sulfur transferase LarE [Planctomycetaceae bacterium]
MPCLSPELTAKRERLIALLADCGRVAVAFSGGVDSTVVAHAAWLACRDRAVAVTAVSDSLASGEREAAERVARQIGNRPEVNETAEFENADYRRNAPNRCYFCKTELYTRLEMLAPRLGVDVIVNGANVDDQGDWRPGMQAARERAVRSPLMEVGLTKADVRELARDWGLPTWDKPASPCLSSRIAYGVEVTPERVARVDAAERFLKSEFDLRELRVRHEANDLARLEVPCDELARFLDPAIRQRISEKLHALGFKFVSLDLDGFRSGSLNAVLPLVELRSPGHVANDVDVA